MMSVPPSTGVPKLALRAIHEKNEHLNIPDSSLATNSGRKKKEINESDISFGKLNGCRQLVIPVSNINKIEI